MGGGGVELKEGVVKRGVDAIRVNFIITILVVV